MLANIIYNYFSLPSFLFLLLSSILCFFVLHFFFFLFNKEGNSLEFFSLNTDTQAGLVLNILLALEVTLILGFQIIISFTAINIIQSIYFKIMGKKSLVRKKELGLNHLLLLLE